MVDFTIIGLGIFCLLALVFNKQLSEIARRLRGYGEETDISLFRLPFYIIGAVIVIIAALTLIGVIRVTYPLR